MYKFDGFHASSKSWMVVSRVVGSVSLVAGLALLLVAVVGEYTSLGELKNAHPKHWDQLDLELVARTPNLDFLIAEAHSRIGDAEISEVSELELMNELYQVAVERFVHGAAEHTLFSNWIIWAQGTTRAHPIRIADSNELLRRSHTALCGQVSQVLVDMARQSGIEARLIDLDGHVVMEAFHGDSWHMYDVDAEVGPNDTQNSLPSLESLSNSPERLEALYSANNPQMIPLLLRSEKHHYVSNLNPARLRFERVSEIVKYILPLLMIALGWKLLRWGRQGNALNARHLSELTNW